MFAVRLGAGRSGANPLPPWHPTRKPRLRLPASGIELEYIALTAAFAAFLGVAIATFTTTDANTTTIAPAVPGASTDITTINAATTGTSQNTDGAGQIAGGDGMSPALIHNLGTRSAVTSSLVRF